MKSELKLTFAAEDIVEDCDHEEAVKVEDGAGAGGKERVVVETRDAAADQKESPLSPTRVLSGSPPPLLASSPHHLDQPPLPDLS